MIVKMPVSIVSHSFLFAFMNRKMFPFSKKHGYEKLWNDLDKENRQPDYSYRGTDINNNDETYVIPDTYLNKDVDGCGGSVSSGYDSMSFAGSPPRLPFSIHEDELCRSFDSLLLPLRSYRGRHDDSSFSFSSQSIEYLPLNSFQYANPSVLPSTFYSDIGKIRHFDQK